MPAQEARSQPVHPSVEVDRAPDPQDPPRAVRKLQEQPWDPASFAVEPAEGKTRFQDLNLPLPVFHALADLEFAYCTPIQAATLPQTLHGRDAAGKAQTGTGKTAAFLITILTRLIEHPPESDRHSGTPRALILAPTRELVLQIEKDARELAKYTDFNILSLFGGMDFDKQRRRLEGIPLDIVVATPGRLLDFKRRRALHLGKVEILVIDEADRMLDMGFIPDVKQIVHSTPPKSRRQTLFFSATLTTDVVNLARQWTTDAESVEIDPEHVAADTVDQQVYIVTADEKFPLLYNFITQRNLERVIVFCNRRDETRSLGSSLERRGIATAILSGDVNQNRRIKTLENFRAGKIRVLVATDVAARGIHIEGISHVVNYNLPDNPEDYVHRIGRTGRAGQTGTSISFADEDESYAIPGIEEYLGQKLQYLFADDELLQQPPRPAPMAAGESRGPAPRRNRPRRRKNR